MGNGLYALKADAGRPTIREYREGPLSPWDRTCRTPKPVED